MRQIVGMSLSAVFGVSLVAAYIILLAEPAYIPSEAMTTSAHAAASPTAARLELSKILHACAPEAQFAETDVGNRMSVIHSLENDVGFLATTRIKCTGERCSVEASALIAHTAKPDTCGNIGSRRGHYGRKHGWTDYFAST